LPFSLSDEDLAKIFEDTLPTSAHIVRTRNGRSRGYGFVEFSNAESREAALHSKTGYEIPDIDGKPPRVISIAESLSDPNENKGQGEENL